MGTLSLYFLMVSTTPSIPAVSDSSTCDSSKLQGADVTLGGVQRVTGVDGAASFSVPAGDYDLEILKDGYDPIFEQLQVSGDANLSRGLAPSPPPPATDLNPLMVFVHPPIAIASYVLVFAFAAYLLMRTTRTKTLFRLGFSAWLFTLLALVSGMIWAQSAWGSYWSWEPKEATALALFVLISAAVIALDEGRMDVTRLLALASCAPILLALPYYFALVGIALMLIVYAARLDRDPEAKRSPAAVHRRAAAIKLNRVVSWLFAAFAVASLASGYVLTRLGVDPALTTLMHTYLGYVFAALLSIHVALSLMAGYPWVMILRNFRDRRSSLSVAMLIQEATAVALLILSAGQVLTGLGWANPYIAALIPLRVHVDLDAALLLVIIIHGAAGVKFASMRRRLSLPGGDLLLVAITVLLTAIVYYLAL